MWIIVGCWLRGRRLVEWCGCGLEGGRLVVHCRWRHVEGGARLEVRTGWRNVTRVGRRHVGEGGLVRWRGRPVFTGGRLPVANCAERSHIVCV